MALRIGHLSTFYHTAPLLIMQEGFEQAMGRKVVWRLFGTGPAIVEALERGELDMAYIGLPPAIVGMDRGVPIKCIAGGHMEGTVIVGNSECSAYPEASSLKQVMDQFRGHVIGVPGKGSIHDVILSDCMKKFDLARDVEVINFRWADEIVDSLAAGSLKGAFGTPALAVAARHYAKGKMIFPPELLWPNNPSYGIVAREDFIKSDEALASRFLSHHEEATATFRNRPAEASEIIARMVGLVDSAFVMETLEISPKYCAQLTREYIECTMRFVSSMRALGYIKNDIMESRIFDRALIDIVHPPGEHYN